MTARASEPRPPDGGPAPGAETREEGPVRITYEGSAVPWWLVVLFAAFIGWGIYYLVKWVPASWMEWFSHGGQ